MGCGRGQGTSLELVLNQHKLGAHCGRRTGSGPRVRVTGMAAIELA